MGVPLMMYSYTDMSCQFLLKNPHEICTLLAYQECSLGDPAKLNNDLSWCKCCAHSLIEMGDTLSNHYRRDSFCFQSLLQVYICVCWEKEREMIANKEKESKEKSKKKKSRRRKTLYIYSTFHDNLRGCSWVEKIKGQKKQGLLYIGRIEKQRERFASEKDLLREKMISYDKRERESTVDSPSCLFTHTEWI